MGCNICGGDWDQYCEHCKPRKIPDLQQRVPDKLDYQMDRILEVLEDEEPDGAILILEDVIDYLRRR